MDNNLRDVCKAFCFDGEAVRAEPYGNGHINDTYLVTCRKNYILQRINHHIFRNPDRLIDNIAQVTRHLAAKTVTLQLIPVTAGGFLHTDESGHYWRAYDFVENTFTCEQVTDPQEFYECGIAFGDFQKQLADFPAETLYETLPDFHNTRKRIENLKAAIKADSCGRCQEAQDEIAFALSLEQEASRLTDLLEQGKLPIRVTHNDTKINNILLDPVTRKGVCVIDLDTVMPGLSLYDFGDAIRSGATTAAEDEQDLNKVSFDLSLYEAFSRGFLKSCGDALTDLEKELLPLGAITMTYECGIRFLEDHLNNDTYFKVHREGHNLDRCRTQFKLVRDMTARLEEMKQVTDGGFQPSSTPHCSPSI